MLALLCFAIVVSSIIGGLVPLLFRPTHRRMQLAISFVGGVMAGVAILDLLPEALENGDAHCVMGWLLAGFLTLFLLERFLPSHCHDVAEDHQDSHCEHEHRLTGVGAFVGLTIHSLLAGVALAAAWMLGGLPIALGVFVAIVLHKPFDALTLVALLRVSNTTRSKIIFTNVIYSLTVPCGVLLFILSGSASPAAISWAIAFSAGMFLCISLCDLLPELQFHGHDRFSLTIALLLGLAVAWGIAQSHSHDAHTHELNEQFHEHEEHSCSMNIEWIHKLQSF
ncbi:ZIP family metal transporter [PVC group bacterium]|nr:ZIP family metal transporter [PVC group bacterium]